MVVVEEEAIFGTIFFGQKHFVRRKKCPNYQYGKENIFDSYSNYYM